MENKLYHKGKDLTNKIIKRKYIYPTTYLEKKVKYIDFIREILLIKLGINSKEMKNHY